MSEGEMEKEGKKNGRKGYAVILAAKAIVSFDVAATLSLPVLSVLVAFISFPCSSPLSALICSSFSLSISLLQLPFGVS